ncbi:glypican-5-like [Elysia marginata]|uniref:Glypican-5-like n=1 Tax=Elysia marginata TaxID=1093978 RepID=A0AAV4I1K4_9GAST|nr:glypican-5-like [Elysia marginata]
MSREHLLQSLEETKNKTSATLSRLFDIPLKDHQRALDSFTNKVESFFMGGDRHRPEEIVVAFFADLFPSVYQHVLSDWRDTSPQTLGTSLDSFRTCLIREHNKILPFGSVPFSMIKHLKYAMQRTRVFLEALDVLLATVEMANHGATIDYHCSHAVTRLQFCSMCSGNENVKPCRGLCLNVMRGCLSKVAEVSSAWDDLVIAFQNLEIGMFSHHNAQELLAQLDVNVTEAIMKAMNERARIHTEVMSLCDQLVSKPGNAKTRFSVSEGRLPPGV